MDTTMNQGVFLSIPKSDIKFFKELAKKMGFTRVLILTFKPAVQTAWREDLISHVDFEGWQ